MAILCTVVLTAVAASSDWLVIPPNTPVALNSWSSTDDLSGFELTNSLITRRFAVGPGTWATVDFVSHVRRSCRNIMLCCLITLLWLLSIRIVFNLYSKSLLLSEVVFHTFMETLQLEDTGDVSLLRGFSPETVVTLDGVAYPVGGLIDSSCSSSNDCKIPPGAFFNRSTLVKPDPAAFRYVSHHTTDPTAPFEWTPGTRGSPSDAQWPPAGLHLVVEFEAPADAPEKVANITVEVHYEM